MFYPNVEPNGNTRETVSQWLGYNHNFNLSDGEFYDMENLSSDCYPYISPRKIRPVLKVVPEGIRGMLYTNGTVCYLYGNSLHYSETEQDVTLSQFSDMTSKQSMVRIGANIVFFPAKVYFNTITKESGLLEAYAAFTSSEKIRFEYCTYDGVKLAEHHNTSTTKPSSPSEGDYWLDTENNMLKVFDADTNQWVEVTGTYLRVSAVGSDGNDISVGWDSVFAEGDAVFANTNAYDMSAGTVIQKVTATYFVIIGMLSGSFLSEQNGSNVRFERRVPDLDFVIESNNRLWGCRYGKNADGTVENTIYASKLGDFKNWFVYSGISTDSYAVNVGSDGSFTGAITYQGYPTFFKENAIYKVYGRYPAEYQLVTINARGVQEGSSKSLAIVNEYLMYKSVSDVCVFDGSFPRSISEALGKEELYYNGVAGACLGKYYIKLDKIGAKPFTAVYKDGDKIYTDKELNNEINPRRGKLYRDAITGLFYEYDGESFIVTGSAYYDPTIFVYDLEKGMWHKEDGLHIDSFVGNASGQMYGYAGARLYGFGSHDSTLYLTADADTEDYVRWYAETGDQGYEYPDYKYINRFTIRAHVPVTSELKISIAYDDGEWQELGIMREPNKTSTVSFSFSPIRCDHYRLRMEGHGDVRIITLSRQLDTESDDE